MNTSFPTQVQELLSNPFVSMATARQLTGFSGATLDRFIREGQLKTYRNNGTGHRRVRMNDLLALLTPADKVVSNG